MDLAPDTPNPRWQLTVIGLLLVVVLSVGGWFATTVYESLKQFGEQQRVTAVELGKVAASTETVLEKMKDFEQRIRENDRRITLRENDQVTARDAARLAAAAKMNARLLESLKTQVGDLTKALAGQRDAHRKELDRLRDALRRVWAKLPKSSSV